MKHYAIISSLVVLAVATLSLAQARPEGTVKKDPGISVARQLRLMRELQLGEESLAASLRRNRQQWEQFSPGQRNLVREKVWAFRKSSPAEQQAILSQYSKFIELSPTQKEHYRQRMSWVKRVLEALSAKERADLLALPPAEQARELLRLKKLLPATGKPTASRPAREAPTTPPATEF